jgi:phage gpG-like protein
VTGRANAQEWTGSLADDLAEFAEKVADMQPAWQAAGEAIREHVEQRFQSSTAPDGEPWAPLSPAYANAMKVTWGPITRGPDGRFRKRVAMRTPRRKDGKILIQDRTLANSIKFRADKDGVAFGHSVIYGDTHQFGDDDRNIPARPFLPVLPDGSTDFSSGTPAGELFEEIEETLMDWMDISEEERARMRAAR